jgi:hypothetical protein
MSNLLEMLLWRTHSSGDLFSCFHGTRCYQHYHRSLKKNIITIIYRFPSILNSNLPTKCTPVIFISCNVFHMYANIIKARDYRNMRGRWTLISYLNLKVFHCSSSMIFLDTRTLSLIWFSDAVISQIVLHVPFSIFHVRMTRGPDGAREEFSLWAIELGTAFFFFSPLINNRHLPKAGIVTPLPYGCCTIPKALYFLFPCSEKSLGDG